MNKLLDKYRDEARRVPEIRDVAGEPYAAFKAVAAPLRRIDIRPRRDAQRLVSYASIGDIVYAGNRIGILGHTCTIDIEGRNLASLIQALQEERVLYIQEFSPKRFGKPADDAPVVESIKIIDKLSGDSSVPETPPIKH